MLWTAFILGLAGSLHCAGMCGPLAIALPHPGRGMAGFVAGRLFYQLGRLVTYMALGAAFGLLGRSLILAGVQQWVSIGAGLLILSGLVASLWAGTSVPLNQWVARVKGWLGWWLQRRTLGSLAVLGLVNGLLPCGLVYAACAGATASGDAGKGLLYMGIFGLGTVPMMLGLSLGGQVIPMAMRLRLQRLIPVSLGLVGVLLVLRGMALGIPYLSPDVVAGTCCAH
jgi:sulfite exporter TauE/SafE